MRKQNLDLQDLSLKDLPEVLRVVHSIQQRQVPGFFWNESDLKNELQVARGFGLFEMRDSFSKGSDQDSLPLSSESFLKAFLLVRSVDDKIWDITLLGVDPLLWGQGLMGQMLQAWKSSVLTPCEVWLEVHSQNQQALSFYQKQGFLVTGRRSHYYRDGGDALLMVLKQT